MGAGYICEGYKRPAHGQKAIAPATTVSAKPLKHNIGTIAHNRFLQTELSPALELDLSATHLNRSPVQRSIHRGNTELGNAAWMPSENGSLREEPASVRPAGSCNQQPVSTYATVPYRSQIQWTIPSMKFKSTAQRPSAS